MSIASRSSRSFILLPLAALLTCCTGCLDMMYAYGEMQTKIEDRFTPRSYTQVQFQVLDGDTLQPLSGLSVGVDNCAMYDWFRDDSSGVTDRQGRVTLRVIRNRTPSVGADLDGYMRAVAAEASLGADPPASRVLHLYREPRPYHVLQVPVGFEGTIRVHVINEPDPSRRPTPRDWPNWHPGDRAFVSQLDPAVLNDLQPLPDLGLTPQDSQAVCGAQWSDGSQLLIWLHKRFVSPPPQSPPATQPAFNRDTVAMWDLGYRAGLYYYFYVGTLHGAWDAQQQLEKEIKDPALPPRFYFTRLPGHSETLQVEP
jgi:hypothetical protein